MAEKQSAATLDGVPVRNLKAKMRSGSESELRGGELLEVAIGAMPVKVAAGHMGISDSLLSRGLKNADHLSFHRVMRLPETELIRLALTILDHCGAEVETLVRVRKGA